MSLTDVTKQHEAAQQTILGFGHMKEVDGKMVRVPARSYADVSTVEACPQVDFLPLGLLLWGTTEETRVQSVGIDCQIYLISNDSIPGRIFEVGRSFEELNMLAETGKLEGTIERWRRIEMRVMYAGSRVFARIEGPFTDIAVWGRWIYKVDNTRYGRNFGER